MTKGTKCDKIDRLLQNSGGEPETESRRNLSKVYRRSSDGTKKFQKDDKKYLTKTRSCDIINYASWTSRNLTRTAQELEN